jgi:serine/threonine protein kinase
MHGGKTYGKGMKGIVMDPEDLQVGGEESVLVYVPHGKYRAKWGRLDKTDVVCKVFKEHYGIWDWLLCQNRAPSNFRREIMGMRRLIKIFGLDQIEKYTTIPAGVLGMRKNGLYVTFTKKCEAQIDDVELGVADIQKLIQQTLSCVAVLQKNNLVHCDIKPGNILKCGGDFKIIDWELMQKLDWKTSQHYSGDAKFTSPFAYVIQGKDSDDCLDHWVEMSDPGWRQTRLFKFCHEHIAADLAKIGRDGTVTFKNHKFHFDMFSLGLTFAYLMFKNKIDPEPYMKLLRGLVSLFGFEDASAALHFHEGLSGKLNLYKNPLYRRKT